MCECVCVYVCEREGGAVGALEEEAAGGAGVCVGETREFVSAPSLLGSRKTLQTPREPGAAEIARSRSGRSALAPALRRGARRF